jgi:hypothetical protein
LKKRGQPAREERRQAQVEVNLLAESEGGRVITKTRRGCSIPFLGGSGLLLIALEAVRTVLG